MSENGTTKPSGNLEKYASPKGEAYRPHSQQGLNQAFGRLA